MKNTSITSITSIFTSMAAVAAMVLAGSVHAQTSTPRIDQRQANQQARIDQGVATGAVTPVEQAKLQAQQGKIASDKAVAKADGKVTRAERRKLTREQNRASRNIAHKKHNRVKKAQ
jgi:hypothetical protein